MAEEIKIRGRTTSLPGTYAAIRVRRSLRVSPAGPSTVLLVDTGVNRRFGGLSGVMGEVQSGANAVYRFVAEDKEAFLDYINGGPMQTLGSRVFSPGPGVTGTGILYFVRACSTTGATVTMNFPTVAASADGTIPETAAAGSISFKTRDEGIYPNTDYFGASSAFTTLSVSHNPSGTAAPVAGDTISISTNIGGTRLVLVDEVTVEASDLTGNGDADANAILTKIIARIGREGSEFTTSNRVDATSSSAATVRVTLPSHLGEAANGATFTITYNDDDRSFITVEPVPTTGNAGSYSLPTSAVLYKGYLVTVASASNGAFEFIFYKGRYKGTDESLTYRAPGSTSDEDVEHIDGVPPGASEPEEILRTPPFRTLSEFHTWSLIDPTFKEYFHSPTISITGAGTISSRHLADGGMPRSFTFSGGTEDYSADARVAALNAVASLPIDYILADRGGDEAAGSENIALEAAARAQLKGLPCVYIGGGNDANKLSYSGTTRDATTSVGAAESYDSENVKIVHGAVVDGRQSGVGNKRYNTLYTAATFCGMAAGFEPQNGLQRKVVSVRGLVHDPTDIELETANRGGVMTIRRENVRFLITHDINTIQGAEARVIYSAPKNGSYLGTILSIKRVIHRGVERLLNEAFLDNKESTIANVRLEEVEAHVDNYLRQQTAVIGENSLIVEHDRVEATLQGSSVRVFFGIRPNRTVSFFLPMGVIRE